MNPVLKHYATVSFGHVVNLKFIQWSILLQKIFATRMWFSVVSVMEDGYRTMRKGCCSTSCVNNSISFFHLCCKKCLFLTLPSKHLLVFKTSWRRLQDMSWRCLQHVFNVTVFRLPRSLEDALQLRLEDTSWRRLEDMSWIHLEDMFWRRSEDMSWKHFQEVLEIKKMGISVSHKSKCVCI